jgi:hypothetical protein
MAKSRRNVSRRKRQQKRRNSRRNFRKLLRGGGLVDNFTKDELEGFFKGWSTTEKIKETIERLREKKTWGEFEKDYDFGKLISPPTVKSIIETEQKKKQAAPAAPAAEAAEAAKAAAPAAEKQGYVNWREDPNYVHNPKWGYTNVRNKKEF